MSKYDNIRAFVENLFSGAPSGERTDELKEELTLNLYEKYDDLIALGRNEDDAYAEIIDGVGDVGEFFSDTEQQESREEKTERERKQRLRALLTVLAVGLYFLAAVVALFPDFLYISRKTSLPSAIILIGIATCAFIFASLSFPRQRKAGGTVVGDLKLRHDRQRNLKRIRGSLISIIWCASPVLYFIFSFTYGFWHMSWMVFLLALIAQHTVILIFSIAIWKNTEKYAKKVKNAVTSLVWCSTPFLYFMISFTYNNWHISWIIFPLAVVADRIAGIMFDLTNK